MDERPSSIKSRCYQMSHLFGNEYCVPTNHASHGAQATVPALCSLYNDLHHSLICKRIKLVFLYKVFLITLFYHDNVEIINIYDL